jgi:hypothetical protein
MEAGTPGARSDGERSGRQAITVPCAYSATLWALRAPMHHGFVLRIAHEIYVVNACARVLDTLRKDKMHQSLACDNKQMYTLSSTSDSHAHTPVPVKQYRARANGVHLVDDHEFRVVLLGQSCGRLLRRAVHVRVPAVVRVRLSFHGNIYSEGITPGHPVLVFCRSVSACHVRAQVSAHASSGLEFMRLQYAAPQILHACQKLLKPKSKARHQHRCQTKKYMSTCFGRIYACM